MSMTKGAVRPNARREDERMSAKEWLSRGKSLEIEIRQLKEQRERALDDATAISLGNGERVQSTHDNASEKKMVAYADYSELIRQRLEELYQVKEEIFRAICQVEDGTLRTLLIGRYINGKTWEQIAVDMCYSYSQTVKYLHPRALHAIECHIDHAV